MTRFLMAVLMIGSIGCGVDGGPTTSPAPEPTDDPTAATSAASSSSADQQSPHFISCAGIGVCEPIADCIAAGGTHSAACGPITPEPVNACCTLD